MSIKQAKRESDPSKDMMKDYDVLVSKIPLRLKQEQHDLVDRLRKEIFSALLSLTPNKQTLN